MYSYLSSLGWGGPTLRTLGFVERLVEIICYILYIVCMYVYIYTHKYAAGFLLQLSPSLTQIFGQKNLFAMCNAG